jgi:dienelactone hydrolase
MPSVPLTAILTLPKGWPPYPAVILLHGCGGCIGLLKIRAARLTDRGYASIAPYSYIPRGVLRVCAGPAEQKVVTPQHRAGDVISAALWLRTRPEIDGNRIGVVGFSGGGWTAMWVTQRRYAQQHPGLIKATVSYYGNCAQAERRRLVAVTRRPQSHTRRKACDEGRSFRSCNAVWLGRSAKPSIRHAEPVARSLRGRMPATRRPESGGTT